MRLPFVKAHACGNDFLLIEEQFAQRRHSELARSFCTRNTGVGADGVEFFERRDEGMFFLRLFNADGSEAELSGNGTRCVAAWLAASEGVTDVVFGTHGGSRRCRIVEGSERGFIIESEMGVPRVMQRTIVLPEVGEVRGAMVNTGNPHFVLFVESDDFETYGRSWQELGGLISASPLFPHGTNVEFVRVLSSSEIAFRIYERGCGPTTSSGTGTCAASAAAMVLKRADRHLTARAEGGAQTTVWEANDVEMRLTGPAAIVCQGEIWAD